VLQEDKPQFLETLGTVIGDGIDAIGPMPTSYSLSIRGGLLKLANQVKIKPVYQHNLNQAPVGLRKSISPTQGGMQRLSNKNRINEQDFCRLYSLLHKNQRRALILNFTNMANEDDSILEEESEMLASTPLPKQSDSSYKYFKHEEPLSEGETPVCFKSSVKDSQLFPPHDEKLYELRISNVVSPDFLESKEQQKPEIFRS
jgi:hypothetical protein